MSDQGPGPEYPKYPGDGPAEGTAADSPLQPPPGPASPPPDRPSSLSAAVRLMQLGAVLSLLSVIVSSLTLDTLKDSIGDAMREADPSVSQTTIDAAYSVGIISGLIGGVIAVGLWLWMAWKNGQGRSWARIVATVFGALNLVFTALSFGSPGMTAVSLGFGAINLVLAAVIIVLLWQKPSSAYYNAVSQRPI
ncbi:MAG: hypothetical protein ACRDOT_02130 [Aeromicrobium sp.]